MNTSIQAMFLQYKEVPKGTPALEIIEKIPLMGRMYTNLPYKPHYGYRNGEPLHVGEKELAVQKARLIQFNSPISIKYLVVDIDVNNALFLYLDKYLPPPHIIVENLLNGHCHYIYEIAVPVFISMNANLDPIRYFAAIQRNLVHELGGDKGFTHYICKNMFIADDRQRVLYGQFPAYELGDLAKYLDLDKVEKPKKLEDFASEGRNCELFHGSRFWAYPQKNHHTNLHTFSKVVLSYALEFNDTQFQTPLGYNEVVGVANSVSNWTWLKYDGKHARKEKCQRLAKDGKKGGKANGRRNRNKRTEAQLLLNSGMNVTAIATKLKISRQTVYNWGLKK